MPPAPKAVHIRLPGNIIARKVRVKCYRSGCRRSKTGYLDVKEQTGQLRDRMGHVVANLREQDYACAEHGIASGGEFLYRDSEN